MKLTPCVNEDCKAFVLWYVKDDEPEAWAELKSSFGPKWWMHSHSHCVVCKHFTGFDLYRKSALPNQS